MPRQANGNVFDSDLCRARGDNVEVTLSVLPAGGAIRVLGYVLSVLTLGVGFLMIAFGGAGLHDRLAGTRVMRRERG